jgi:putative ATPase
LKHLETEEIVKLIKDALKDEERGLGNFKIEINDETIELLAELSGGDARVALNALELAVRAKTPSRPSGVLPLVKGETNPPLNKGRSPAPRIMRGGTEGLFIDNQEIKEALQRTHLVFDKRGEEFYNLISALHKSMRGSDPNAALYWLARMLEGGADPLYVARRVLRFASEDIGMANSEALIQANAAYDACHKIGMPECSVHLAQAVVYCAKSTKSNLLYRAYEEAARDAKNTSHLGVPIHLRNAPTKFMKEIGYGKDYKYPPDMPDVKSRRAGNPDFDGPVEQDYLPKELKGRNYLGIKKNNIV